MSGQTAKAPLFRQIADALRNDIHNHVLAPGDKLPSEHQMVERFSTTRATIRKAVALLRSEGLVVSHQGKGAFVRPRPTVRLLSAGANYRERRESGMANFNAEAAAQGKRATQYIREVVEVPASTVIAERLGVPTDTPLIARRLLFVVDDEPMQLVDAYYTKNLVDGTPITEPRRIRGGVHRVLEDPDGPIRRKVSRFVEDLDIRMPSPAETEQLHIPPGVPLARVFRTAYDAQEEALEVLDSLVPCDRHVFRYVIEVPDRAT